MAIRICFGGREYQRLELKAVAPQVEWHVHTVTASGRHERQAFAGTPSNFLSALAYAEEQATHRPSGDIWLADDASFTPVRFGIFEPNESRGGSHSAS